jgi:large subunit ribosomal protein L21
LAYKEDTDSGSPKAYNVKVIYSMYVIVDIQGQQFKVQKDQKLFVHRIDANEGDSVEFDKVLLIENDSDITIGSPTVEGAKVVVEILSHVKGDKVLVFKKKRRKGYRKLNGHRQQFSRVIVKDIIS